MKTLNKKLKQYYAEWSKVLSCDRRKKKILVARLRSDVACYRSENPDATFDDITRKFGTPQEMAEQYYDGDTAEQLAQKLNRGKKIALVVAAALVLLIVVLVCVVISQAKTPVVYEDRDAAVTEIDCGTSPNYSNPNKYQDKFGAAVGA